MYCPRCHMPLQNKSTKQGKISRASMQLQEEFKSRRLELEINQITPLLFLHTCFSRIFYILPETSGLKYESPYFIGRFYGFFCDNNADVCTVM